MRKSFLHLFFKKEALLFLLTMSAAHATPFIPPDDGVVLEHLPDARDALRAKHRALAADPHNLKLALDVAHGDLDRSRELGDPRFLGRAEAALAPWPAIVAPPDVTLLRAVIAQSNHDFDGALAMLHQAQANYPAALADCGQVAGLVLGLVPDVCTASVMALTGHAPLALRAVGLSLQTNADEATRAPGVAMWALTLGAETAARLDDPAAEGWYQRALAVNSRDPYLLGAWSDWLLDHGRPSEVVTLLAGYTRVDPLLLRLALAEAAVSDPAEAGHVADLAARFEASRLRGEFVHRREQARFTLFLLHRPAEAVALAAANWGVQREPADARILLEAAIASGQLDAAAPVVAWFDVNHVQDMRLAPLVARVRPVAKT
jgi:hypothetical protein